MAKRLFSLAILIISAFSAVPLSAQDTAAEEFKPSGKPLVVIFSNVHTTFSDNKYLTAFEITRGYLGYDYSFSRQISGRIIYDATAQNVSGATIMAGYLRNAFLQYSNGTIQIRGGLIPLEHLSIADGLWNYRYVARSLSDISGMVYSADLGASIKYTPTGAVALDFSVTNGRGYKDLAADSVFRYSAGITLRPVNNLTLRGLFDIMPYNNASQWTTGLLCNYSGKNFSLGAEFDMQKNHSGKTGDNYSGFTVFGSYNLNEHIAFFGRFHNFSSVVPAGETTSWNNLNDNSTTVLGMEYSPVKGVRIAPNVTFIDPDASSSPDKTIAGLNIEVKF